MSSIGTTYLDLFIDPITHQMMRDPYTNECGHIFDKSALDNLLTDRVTQQLPRECPLCKAPIGNLLRSMLTKHAIDVLNHPKTNLSGRVDDLTEEDLETLDAAANRIRSRREADALKNIPDRLPLPKSFKQKVEDAAQAYAEYCGCVKKNSTTPVDGKG